MKLISKSVGSVLINITRNFEGKGAGKGFYCVQETALAG